VANATAEEAPYFVLLSFKGDGDALSQELGERFDARGGFDLHTLAT